ncbi:MAG: pyruvate kinase [Erysipelotrichaceae bacterium]|nr:pyruvate kinase [Erysipelotrichaceae bacterium]
MRKTKIICTIGPTSESPEMLVKLYNAGMNVARLNFSHGNYEEHGARIKSIRNMNWELGAHVAIMLDTKGPEIRVGKMDGTVEFQTGDTVILTSEEVLGTHERFQLCCPELFHDVEVGTRILMDDGKMTFTVTEKMENGDLKTRVENSGELKTKKGVNVPGVVLTMPFISEKDDADIRFACRNRVDYIAASFVRRPEDVLAIREILKEEGNEDIEIIAKIENQEGYDNLQEILKVADAVMVARGDLGVEVSYGLVPIYQKNIIKIANAMGKPVITATHMLESMIHNPRPTRAEASDVANAVLDGSDAIMLSGETAAGEYPEQAVKTMSSIAEATEALIDHVGIVQRAAQFRHRSMSEVIGIAVAESCVCLDNVSAVMAFTETGGTAKRLIPLRPAAPVIAATNSEKTARRLAMYWGVFPIVDNDITDSNMYDECAKRIARKIKLPVGSTMIICAGWRAGHGNTNTMRYMEVEH